jgi:flagellar basal-body rod protein FlgB
MDSGNSGLLDLLARKLTYLNQSQVVRAQNVANASTPGYKPLDVVPFSSFTDTLKQVNTSMAVTDPRHIVPASLTNSNPVATRPKGKDAEDSGDVEQESMKVSQIGIEYNMLTTVYHKMASFFKIALRGSA